MAEAALGYIRGQVTESPKQINLDSATGMVLPTLLRRLLEEDLSFSTCQDHQIRHRSLLPRWSFAATQRPNAHQGTLPGSTPARLSTGGRYAAQ